MIFNRHAETGGQPIEEASESRVEPVSEPARASARASEQPPIVTMPPAPERPTGSSPASVAKGSPTVRLRGLRAFYGNAERVKGIDLDLEGNQVTAIIGPSGCGKSTMIRCINRMHEEIPGARSEGRVLLDDVNLYDPAVDVIAVRRTVGMVFQRPNPFPTMSIFGNVAAGLRLTGVRGGSLERLLHAPM